MIKVTRLGADWKTVLRVARITQNKPDTGKEPSDDWKKKLILSRHSPLRMIEFLIEGEAKGFVLNHIARHTYQSPKPFIGTAREDITGVKRPSDTAIRPFALYINADALIEMCEQRMCFKAHADTMMLVHEIITNVSYVEPLLAEVLKFTPCEKTGICREFTPCFYEDIKDRKAWEDLWK